MKPQNIFVDQRGEPVVVDFGLARRGVARDATLTQSGALMGTPAYMAPEQARGHIESVGPHSDVYSLGVGLLILLGAGLPTPPLPPTVRSPPPPPTKPRGRRRRHWWMRRVRPGDLRSGRWLGRETGHS